MRAVFESSLLYYTRSHGALDSEGVREGEMAVMEEGAVVGVD